MSSSLPLVVSIFENKNSRMPSPQERAYRLLLSHVLFLKRVSDELKDLNIISDIHFPVPLSREHLIYNAKVEFTNDMILEIRDFFVAHSCDGKTIMERKFSAYLIDPIRHRVVVGWDNEDHDPKFVSWPLHRHTANRGPHLESKEQSLPEIMITVVTKYVVPSLL
ncbi:DUF6516 family protein [Thermococcus sp. GR4]|uniref:toxin-antitoxin system TumE family protein n=1 Tax=Thermococcus sp. GR4 TaxID=1638254 RepID=UPI001430A2CD|nr:DUF6516 family protein [Thermococcus sp. GR4]NJE79419.1 hypothetical protein [Thermococcus sp. GR4]